MTVDSLYTLKTQFGFGTCYSSASAISLSRNYGVSFFNCCNRLCLLVPSPYAEQPKPPNGHYLFAWAGDRVHEGKDFLAVIDADPGSSSYGHLITTLVTDQTSL